MTIQLVAEHPEVEVAFQAGTIMAAVDRWHFDSRDGSVYVVVGGARVPYDITQPLLEGTEGGQPAIVQGSDVVLRIRTLSNLGGGFNDLSQVQLTAQFRESYASEVIEATANVFTDPNDAQIAVLHLSAASTAGMSAPLGVWDMEARYADPNLGGVLRTKRLLEGRYELSPEVTR